jgi:hypothetical protein
MTLVYMLLGFTGLTGVLIAKDEFDKLGAPRHESPNKMDCNTTTGDTA